MSRWLAWIAADQATGGLSKIRLGDSTHFGLSYGKRDGRHSTPMTGHTQEGFLWAQELKQMPWPRRCWISCWIK